MLGRAVTDGLPGGTEATIARRVGFRAMHFRRQGDIILMLQERRSRLTLARRPLARTPRSPPTLSQENWAVCGALVQPKTSSMRFRMRGLAA